MQQSVLKETSDSWAGNQCIAGPFIKYTVCKTYLIEGVNGKKSNEKSYTDYFIAPKTLHYDAKIIPNEKKRGIYKITTYEADINTEGYFDLAEMSVLCSHFSPNQYSIHGEKQSYSLV